METKEIKELMLLESVEFSDRCAYLNCEDSEENYLEVISTPDDNRWCIVLYDYHCELIPLTDEQYNMICKYVEKEFNEYHSNNTGFTSDDRDHFNSLIN